MVRPKPGTMQWGATNPDPKPKFSVIPPSLQMRLHIIGTLLVSELVQAIAKENVCTNSEKNR